MIKKLFLQHPHSVDETYGQHLLFALKVSGLLFIAAFAALIHALIPAACERTASQLIKAMYLKITSRD